MLNRQIQKILTNNRSIILAYDHGMEHGPVDFNLKNVDPNYVLDIAEKGKFSAIALHHGIAEKYYSNINKVPLLIKLNGKTNIPKIEPISTQICSIKRAVSLGADAVGYTIYSGSTFERNMFKEFSSIVEEAHDYGIPVIAWAYPRGKYVKEAHSNKMTAYAARVALEFGADFIKLFYNGDEEGFKWVVKSAGKARVLAAGGSKAREPEFLKRTKEILRAGGCGLAVGRNVWQHENPLKMAKAIRSIVFENRSVDDALKSFN
ncbi:MAG: Fructose-bisphosphate aldolase class 1 [Candidatus Woesearchaeota archaeon]|nr:Fructose-bisphosphate aldolase class 1 [Candidatus Woesearchaeota archaeon]